MPHGGRELKNKGTNSQGNDYSSYSDGAYRYRNSNADGSTNSKYFNDGHGHEFYDKKGPDGYKWHQNSNQGYRNYTPKK